MKKPCIAITGANGFIGKHAIRELSKKFYIKALSREIPNNVEENENIEWIKCDLFSLKDTENALINCDYLLYLIHSMCKQSKFSQNNFVDFDLIIADNVRRAAKKNKLKQIIYIGGILPNDEENISKHLKSRKEVEKILSCNEIALTCIRAAMIIGPGGSSFQIVHSLVKRLPIMATPRWTNSLSQPIDIIDVINFIKNCVGNYEVYNKSVDVHGSEIISYNSLMLRISKIMNKKRTIITVPFFSLGFSKFWVYIITGADYFTISPLIDTLKHNLIASNKAIFNKYIPQPIELEKSLQKAIEYESHSKPFKKKNIREEKRVRTVQRIHLPAGWNSYELRDECIKWLQKKFSMIVIYNEQQNILKFQLLGINLVTFELSHTRSCVDRQIFYITGGILVVKKQFSNARLEFRLCPHENKAIVAIHDYYPSLPWFIYSFIQSKIQKFLINLFSIHLKKISLKQNKKIT